MAVKLIYQDVALGADKDATVTTDAAVESFSDVAKIPFGVDSSAIGTGEPNGWGLTHDYTARGSQPFAFWSVERSGADCVMASPPTITLDFSKQHTTTGLTIRFAPASMDYCRKVNITWYQGETVKHSGTYYPDTPDFKIDQLVEAFDKLVFTFEETNLPGKRVKIDWIILGVIREFKGDELKAASFVHEIDPISDIVPVNIADAAFHSKDNVDFVFQKKQPVSGYDGSTLLGVYYIESGKRTGARDYEIACHDAIGVLDMDTYDGGIWFEDTPLTDIIADVFGETFAFEISPVYNDATLRGHIPQGSKRNALQHIAFALGAIVDTSGTTGIKIFPPHEGKGDVIPADKTYIGGAVDVADKVTEVTVTAYIFFDERPSTEQPYVEVNGVQYRYYTDTKHAYNPDVVAADLPNKVKFDKSYLVNLSNAQRLADNILAHYMKREKYSFKHVVDGQEPAERATATLPWGDVVDGNITKMSISVTGLTVSDTEMLLDY